MGIYWNVHEFIKYTLKIQNYINYDSIYNKVQVIVNTNYEPIWHKNIVRLN